MLHERFLRARRRVKGPLVLVSEYMMMTNTAAARIFADPDQAPLWEWASRMIVTGRRRSQDFALANGTTVTRDGEPVADGGVMVGALIRVRVPGSVPSAGEGGVCLSDGHAFGWNSLTESERSVADLVAEGLTNREAAAQLFISPDTVDAHLRHIYRKLGIGSRVELTRVVAEQAALAV